MAVSAGSQEKGAIGAMFEREMKQEKNLEVLQYMIDVVFSIFVLERHTSCHAHFVGWNRRPYDVIVFAVVSNSYFDM